MMKLTRIAQLQFTTFSIGDWKKLFSFNKQYRLKNKNIRANTQSAICSSLMVG